MMPASLAMICSISSTTPRPQHCSSTMSTVFMRAGVAFPTAAEQPQASRKAKSFSGVPDANHVVRRQLDLREGNLQASCLIDARRKHHDGTLVEYDLIFKTKLSDDLQHSRFMRTPCCNDAFADRERLHLFFLQRSDEIGRSLITDKVLTLGARIVDHSSVLRDNAGEQVEVGVSESAQFASGHQDRSPSRLLQALERVVS